MGDDPPPPARKMAGEAGGGDPGGSETPTGTPVALNDEHASQASKELLKDVGTDLEELLRAANQTPLLDKPGQDNVFAANLTHGASKAKNNRSKRPKSRFAPVPFESEHKSDDDKGSQTNDQIKNTNLDGRVDEPNQRSEAGDSGAPSQNENVPDQEAQAEGAEKPATETTDGATANESGTKEATNNNHDHAPTKSTAARKTKRRRKGKTAAPPEGSGATEESATKAKTENPWTKAREVLLKEKVNRKAAQIDYDDIKRYKKYYEIAKATHYRVIPDAYARRPLTEEETMALYLWRAKKIHLETPPKFIVETHTLRERLAFEQIQRDLLTYCLHIDTPGQLRMPAETAKYHFYTHMLTKNQTADGPTDVVVDLMTDIHSISVSAESRRAILKFVRPELRDKWEGYVLPFPFGAVTLRAASYFEQEDKRNGLDQETVQLMYSCYLIGKASLALGDVHAIANELSGGIPILNIEPVEPTGANTLDPYMTKITYNSVDAPPSIEQVRELTVKHGTTTFAIGLHQPRLATRQPCSICLETTHYRNKCPNKENAVEVRKPFMREIEIPVAVQHDFEPVADDLDAFRGQLDRLRQQFAPEIAKDAPEDDKATQPTPSPADAGATAPASYSENPTATKPKRRSNKTAKKAQINILLSASKKMTGFSAKPKTPRSPKNNDTAEPPRAPQPKAGDKRSHANVDDRSNTTGPSDSAKTPPTRQARTSVEHTKVNGAKKDAPRTSNRLTIRTHQRQPTHRMGQLTMTPFLPKEAAQPEAEPDASSSPEVEITGHKPADRATEKIDDVLRETRMTEAYECGDAVTTKTDAVHAKRLGNKLARQLSRNLQGMIDDGTLNVVNLCATNLLGGEPEIKAFVEWVHEPVYSVDVMPNGDAFPQWYRMSESKRPDGTAIKRAIVSAVSPASFRAHMDVYKRNQVVPLVLLLHHSVVNGRAVGHFTAARVSNETYRHLVGTKRLRADMKDRLAKVQRVLPFIDPSLSHYDSFPPSPAHTPGEGSVYEPSSPEEGTPSNTTANEMDTPMHSSEPATATEDSSESSLNGATKPTPLSTESPPAPNFNLLPSKPSCTSRSASPLSNTVLSILSMSSQPSYSFETDPTPPSRTRSQALPPVGEQEDELIRNLRARPPYSDELTRQIRNAYSSNNTAFETWRARQRKDNPRVHEAISTAQGPIRATEALQDNIGALVALVHALPYPEVHMATVPDAVLKRAGQAAICEGHAQLLHRIHDQLSGASQDTCQAWLEALNATATTAETRWGLAQSADRWERLEKAANKKRISLPPRARHGIDEAAWCTLLAYLLVIPDCLPWEFTDCPVPQRCDALIAWLAAPEHAEIVNITATAIQDRDWLAARRLFPAPLDGGLSSEQVASLTRAQLGGSEATSQY